MTSRFARPLVVLALAGSLVGHAVGQLLGLAPGLHPLLPALALTLVLAVVLVARVRACTLADLARVQLPAAVVLEVAVHAEAGVVPDPAVAVSLLGAQLFALVLTHALAVGLTVVVFGGQPSVFPVVRVWAPQPAVRAVSFSALVHRGRAPPSASLPVRSSRRS